MGRKVFHEAQWGGVRVPSPVAVGGMGPQLRGGSLELLELEPRTIAGDDEGPELP